jgi:RimJ/RimL family protein N-acetyltransferase
VIHPSPVTLEGRAIRLEPLTHKHEEGLAAAAKDGELWQLFFTFVPDPSGTRAYIDSALSGQDEGHMLPWAVRDMATGEIVGSTRYHDIVPDIDRVEIGYTWYGQSRQRTHTNTTCKLILLEHAFETLGCAVVGLRTDNFNTRSQRAIEALGAKKDGVIRHHASRADGSVRDSVMYSILASEWPDVSKHLETRLWRHGAARD